MCFLASLFNISTINKSKEEIIQTLLLYFKKLEKNEINENIKILDDTLQILEKNNVEKETNFAKRNEIDQIKDESSNSISIKKEFDKISLENNKNKYKRKRNYNQMINEGKNINDKSNTNEDISNKFIKNKKENISHEDKEKGNDNKNKRQIYPLLLNNNESHYYYIDENNIE